MWSRTIKCVENKISVIIVSILAVIMSLLTGALFYEYRFFCAQSQKMLELQEQYQLCASAVRKILRKNNQLQDRAQDVSSYSGMFFPEGARIVSSDDGDAVSDSLVVLNRDVDHLKKSMVSHLKDQRLDSLLSRIDLTEWQDYTEHMLTSAHTQPVLRSASSHITYSRMRKPKKKDVSKKINRDKKVVHTTDFMWPIEHNNFWLSSFFGRRKKQNGSWGMHNGIDMAAIKGTPVKAAAAGVVVEARYASGYGNTIVLAHNKKYKTRCAHLDTVRVAIGQKINKGMVVGTVGDTGFIRKIGSDGSHLHFEVYEFGKRVNPLDVLPSLT